MAREVWAGTGISNNQRRESGVQIKGRVSPGAAFDHLSIAGKLNTVWVAIITAMVLLLLVMLTRNTYQAALEREMTAATEQVAGRADLHWLLYQGDPAGLEQAAASLAAAPLVTSARIYSGIGEQLAAGGDRRSAPFAAMRAAASTTDTITRATNPSGKFSGSGYFATLWGEGHRLQLSLPVITTLNPASRALTSSDFIDAASAPDPEASDFVLGYVQLALDLDRLHQGSFTLARNTLLQWLLPLGLAVAFLLWWNRRVLGNLGTLSTMMDRIAEGDFQQTLELRGGKEFDDMASALTRLTDGLRRHQKEIELGRELLSRKVEERNSQLSRSHEELSRAAEAASESEQRLQRLTYYDALTTLPNRRLFTEQFTLLMRVSRRAGQSVALLFVDLNNLRRINDTMGHHAGDVLLREVAQRLKFSVRDSDTITRLGELEHDIAVSRLGGDQFSVVLSQLEKPDTAATVARRIIRRLSQPIDFEGHPLTVTPTIGIAVFPGDGDNPGNLLNAAAAAMQAAKRTSKDGFLFFKPHMMAEGNQRLQLEADLREVLKRRELVLHYQPQIDTVMGSVVSIEALLRWQHPKRGLIPPREFVALAEEAGLMRKIGAWVLEEACRRLSELHGVVAELPRVAINVSARQFSGDFVDTVRRALATSGLAPGKLELSLSEQVLAVADAELLDTLQALHELGVYLSLDGYGLGQCSLAQVSRLPLDELKIEREFLVQYREDQPGPLLALIATARSLGLRAAAEGVETAEEYQFLAEHGVKHMQGYLYSKPVPMELLKPMLAPWHFSERIRRLGATAEA
jgi:diguanylate cyclase (GGDEF)-like protein